MKKTRLTLFFTFFNCVTEHIKLISLSLCLKLNAHQLPFMSPTLSFGRLFQWKKLDFSLPLR